jgi:hypothetical protein
MAEAEKVGTLIERAQGFGLRLEYRSGFLIVARPAAIDGRTEDFAEMEQVIIGQLGKRLAEVRAQVIAVARAARGKEFIGQRVLIPIAGIGAPGRDSPQGRVILSQISGELAACSGDGELTVSYVETRDDDARVDRTTACASDEAFVVVGSGDQADRSSFASTGSERIMRALERGQSIGLALEFDAGLAVAKWNAALGNDDAGEKILRELGPPRGEIFNVLEGRARGAAGSDFVGQQCFVRALDSFGVIRGCDLGGDLDVTYEDKHLGSRLTCSCRGSDALIIASE